MITVTNPTYKKKAVRSAGGLITIPANSTVEVDDSTWSEWDTARYAAAGLELGGSATPDDDSSASSTTSSTSSRSDLLATLVEGFPEGSSNHWTADGRPALNALNEALPEGTEAFTAGERDEIWKEIQ